MDLKAGKIHHIYSRGNNREKVFFSDENYFYFIKKMRTHLIAHSDILAYCLMPNHFHLLVYLPESGNAENFAKEYGIMLGSYTRGVNRMENRIGSLFQNRSKSKIIHNLEYGLTCFLYIHQNPLRCELVDSLRTWQFSSYPDYAGIRSGTLCNQKKARDLLDLPENYEEFKKFSAQTIPAEFRVF